MGVEQEMVAALEAEMERLRPKFPHLTARQLRHLAADSLDAELERANNGF